MKTIVLPQPAADKIADILRLDCVPPYDTDGPGWGPATVKRLGEFADAAELGNVQIATAQPAPAVPVGAGAFGSALAAVAEGQIGTEEDAAHSNRGSAILKYQEATSLGGQGWPWCAAFVDWCYKTAAGQVDPNAARPKATLQRPETASAFGLVTWANDQGLKVFTPDEGAPQRGDIVVYTFSHTGIVTGYTGGTTFAAVEGNTNSAGGSDGYEVARRTRPFGQVKAFIRVA